MRIKSVRSREELTEVLKDPQAQGPDTAYWVFEGISKGKWLNMTVITSGKYGDEFPKTYGHYHTSDQAVEASKLIHGDGIFVLQKKFYDDAGNWIPEKVAEFYLVHVTEKEEVIYVPKEFAHAWVNVGDLPLITYDDWRETGQPTHTYEEIKKLKGLAYYLIKKENGEPELIKNSNYKDHPEPKVVTAKEFNNINRADLKSI